MAGRETRRTRGLFGRLTDEQKGWILHPETRPPRPPIEYEAPNGRPTRFKVGDFAMHTDRCCPMPIKEVVEVKFTKEGRECIEFKNDQTCGWFANFFEPVKGPERPHPNARKAVTPDDPSP